jgi:formylglycine-generating enzyme
MRAVVVPVGLGLCVLSGCQVIGGFEDFEAGGASAAGGGAAGSGGGGAGAGGTGADGASGGGAGEGGSGAGGTGGAACPDEAAPGDAGPTMVRAQGGDGTCFWIDETEVTRSQYDAFLADGDDPGLQPPHCSWNVAYEPAAACTSAATQPSAAADHPMTCVDQCDAAAYCRWAGKRLCAGGTGADATDAAANEWYAACSNGGTTEYPYGRTYDGSACNGSERTDTGCGSGGCSMTDADALLSCDTDAGATALSGNAAEWTAACNAQSGETDDCLVRGGSVRSNGADLSCSAVTSLDRSFADAFTGFRCCAD